MTGLQVLEVGQGPERLVFLHGLFGQGKNFGTVAKLLGEDAMSVLVDLPNHGRSPWTDYFDYHLFADLLARQVKNEFTASQQYIALAVWFDDHDLPRLAAHDTPGLAHALGEPVALVDAVCARIRHLDPRFRAPC